MIMNKTTKKLKPLFTFTGSGYKTKPDRSLNNTLRIYAQENKKKLDPKTSKNEAFISKLCKFVSVLLVKIFP